MSQTDFIDRLAARRDMPRTQLQYADYGRVIRDVETGKVLAWRSREGWTEVGVDEDRLEA